MQDNDYEVFHSLWIGVCGMYGKEPPESAVQMAFMALKGCDIGDIRRALTAHTVDPDGGRFMPKPADIMRHIQGDAGSRSLTAWTKVESSIGRVGPYQTVVFDDPIIMAVIKDMGGWMQLCSVNNDELPFKRNEFSTRYKGYLNTGLTRYPKRLIGISEASNNTTNHESFIDEPVLIGDAQKALLVYQGGDVKKTVPMKLSDAIKQLGLGRDTVQQLTKEQ